VLRGLHGGLHLGPVSEKTAALLRLLYIVPGAVLSAQAFAVNMGAAFSARIRAAAQSVRLLASGFSRDDETRKSVDAASGPAGNNTMLISAFQFFALQKCSCFLICSWLGRETSVSV